MVNVILTGASIPYKETRFLTPPKTTYAVYLDNMEVRGADYCNLIEEHSVTVELHYLRLKRSVMISGDAVRAVG